MRNISVKSSTENQNTPLYSVTFFYFENPSVYEEMWKNFVESGTPQIAI
jgi:hypothetical protein